MGPYDHVLIVVRDEAEPTARSGSPGAGGRDTASPPTPATGWECGARMPSRAARGQGTGTEPHDRTAEDHGTGTASAHPASTRCPYSALRTVRT